jgi:hypothetical protein
VPLHAWFVMCSIVAMQSARQYQAADDAGKTAFACILLQLEQVVQQGGRLVLVLNGSATCVCTSSSSSCHGKHARQMLAPRLAAVLLPLCVGAACRAPCSWVRSIAFDPGNEYFVTGSADRTIKLWDTGSGQLKLTLTGHIEQVTGLAVSSRHPYMFSASLDKEVKCWDLEHNKVRGGGGGRGTTRVPELRQDHYAGDVGRMSSMRSTPLCVCGVARMGVVSNVRLQQQQHCRCGRCSLHAAACLRWRLQQQWLVPNMQPCFQRCVSKAAPASSSRYLSLHGCCRDTLAPCCCVLRCRVCAPRSSATTTGTCLACTAWRCTPRWT